MVVVDPKTRSGWWVWIYKQVCTQDGGAGGNLAVSITPAAGSAMRLVAVRMLASGTRAISSYMRDSAAGSIVLLGNITATAACAMNLPSIGALASASNNIIDSKDLIIPSACDFLAYVTSAAVTETATITFVALVSTSTKPTVSWAGSGGTPNAAAASIDTITRLVLP